MVGLSRLLWDGVKGSHVKDRVVVEEVFEVLSPACIDMNSGHTMRRKIQLGSVKSIVNDRSIESEWKEMALMRLKTARRMQGNILLKIPS